MSPTTLRLLLALALPLLLGSCATTGRSPAPESSAEIGDGGLDIYIFSPGQADSMLVVGPPPENRSLLIDLGAPMGGDGQTHLRVARRIEELTGRRGVDYFMVSHFHEDHVGRFSQKSPRGVFGLLANPTDRFTIGTWFDRGDEQQAYAKRTRAHRHTLEHLPGFIESGRVGERRTPDFGTDEIQLGGGILVDVLAVGGRVFDGDPGALAAVEAKAPGTYERAPASENDFSIAVEISLGEFEFFTAGDLNGAAFPGEGKPYPASTERFFGKKGSTYTNVETWMVDHWQASSREADVEIYRANHHGSKNSSTADLMDSLDPEVIIYSCGGRYGHPDPEVVHRGAETALQFVTHSAAEKSWPEGLPPELASLAGEIHIRVAADGSRYSIEERILPTWSDAQEASGEDSEPAP